MEINGLVQWLFKWWLILSGVFWGVILSIYLALYVWTWRLTGQWPHK
jgi:hypothetical protein